MKAKTSGESSPAEMHAVKTANFLSPRQHASVTQFVQIAQASHPGCDGFRRMIG
jgi:hypothetical protein